jgi:hypothetical protein
MPDDAPPAAPALPPALEYAPAPSAGRRIARRVTRGLLLLAVLAGAAAAYRYGPAAWGHARLLYHQRQCLRYEAPPEAVVLDDTGGSADGGAGALALVKLFLGGARPTTAPTPGGPACLDPLVALLPANAVAAAGGPGVVAGPVAFMHERVSGNGTRRLVIVSPDCVHLIGPVTTVEPAGVFRASGKVKGDVVSARTRVVISSKMPHVRVFAGRPHPSDRARFTIPFEEDGRPDVVDGVLNDDGTVTLTRRSDPPAPPGPRQLKLEVHELTVTAPSNAGWLDVRQLDVNLRPMIEIPTKAASRPVAP